MVDECHAAGFIRATGKEHLNKRSNGKSRYHYRALRLWEERWEVINS
jgi:hypothetical protein